MQPQRIVIIGAGGQARELNSAIAWINRAKTAYEFLGYVISDLSQIRPTDSRAQILGDFSWLEKNRNTVDALAIGIGTPSLRLQLAAQLKQILPEKNWPVLIHPTAIVDADSACLGEGSYLGAGVTATVNITLEAFAMCNFGCTVGHEARIGAGSVVNPGANISGGVSIADNVLIGTGAQVLQYLRVGSGAIVGAGAVVTHDVAQDTTVVGVPARPLEKTAPKMDGAARRRYSFFPPVNL